MRRSLEIGLALALNATALVGQPAITCSRGAGVPIGVVAYDCADCSTAHAAGKMTYVFGAEPTVVDATPGSPYEPGDVIVAIDGRSLRSADGAEAFAYPHPGMVDVHFRRKAPPDGIVNLHATVNITDACQFGSSTALSTRLGGADAPDSARLVAAATTIRPAELSKTFGFAVACNPGCKQASAGDGTLYWTHDEYPTVVAVGRGSIAGDAGVAIGDRIVQVNGTSVLEEKGAVALLRPSVRPLDLVLMRDGGSIKRRLNVGPAPGTCSGVWLLTVSNQAGSGMEVYYTGQGGAPQYFATAPVGVSQIPLPPSVDGYQESLFFGQTSTTQMAKPSNSPRRGDAQAASSAQSATIPGARITRGFRVSCRP